MASSACGEGLLELILDQVEDLQLTGSEVGDIDSLQDSLPQGISSTYAKLALEAITILHAFDPENTPKPPRVGTSTAELDKFCNGLLSFAKAIGFPDGSIISSGSARLRSNPDSAAKILTFLLSELQAVRMLAAAGTKSGGGGDEAKIGTRNRHKNITEDVKNQNCGEDKAIDQFDISGTLRALDLKPRDKGRDPNPLHCIKTHVTKSLEWLPPGYVISKRLLDRSRFSPLQLKVLADINETLAKDYALRHKVLSKRFELTLKSFTWSGKGKENAEKIMGKVGHLGNRNAEEVVKISLDELFLAGADVLEMKKITATQEETKIKRAIIGNVPDRGGRVGEARGGTTGPSFKPRDPRSENWKNRARGGGGRGRGGGGGRGKQRRTNSGNYDGSTDHRQNFGRGGKGKRRGGGRRGGHRGRSGRSGGRWKASSYH
mmetsp:Transcript_37045/g.59482  ORF Transcript_37045/g.59482 Transcript_37045/m.59482 type:complete len:433 (-) Transcript_37045:155-1453(-)